MKILDRYVLMTFIKNYLISFLVLIGLYVTLDMVFNFDELVEPPRAAAAQSLSVVRIAYDIGDYYFYQCFLFFVQLSGIIPVVAAAFTLVRLSRFNELTAVLAAGTPLLRVAAPIVVAGAVLNLLLLPIDQEIVIPHMIPKLVRNHEDAHSEQAHTFAIQFMQDGKGGLFSAARFSPASTSSPAQAEYVDVVETTPDARAKGHLYAKHATWNAAEKAWDLTDGHYVPIPGPEDTHPEPEHSVNTYKSDVTPDEVALFRGGEYVNLLPTTRIRELLLRPKSYGTNSLLRVLHLRFTQPLVNLILLLLAIPAVLTREPGTLKTAAMRCLLLCGLCLGSVFLAYQLAATPPNAAWRDSWPALMAWMPIFIFGPLAVYSLDRVKS